MPCALTFGRLGSAVSLVAITLRLTIGHADDVSVHPIDRAWMGAGLGVGLVGCVGVTAHGKGSGVVLVRGCDHRLSAVAMCFWPTAAPVVVGAVCQVPSKVACLCIQHVQQRVAAARYLGTATVEAFVTHCDS